MEEKDEVSESRKIDGRDRAQFYLLYMSGLNYLNSKNDKRNQVCFYEIDRITDLFTFFY